MWFACQKSISMKRSLEEKSVQESHDDSRVGTYPGSQNVLCPSSLQYRLEDMDISKSLHCHPSETAATDTPQLQYRRLDNSKQMMMPRCMWPHFRCPFTPAWMMFSSCKNVNDARCAMVWHGLRSPFIIPYGIRGHSCQWEHLDHHMAGCVLCGKVHRCDVDQPEWSSSSSSGAGKCPTEQAQDGSTVCSITGICTRMPCYANAEYEVMCSQGFSRNSSETSQNRKKIGRVVQCPPRNVVSKQRQHSEDSGGEDSLTVITSSVQTTSFVKTVQTSFSVTATSTQTQCHKKRKPPTHPSSGVQKTRPDQQNVAPLPPLNQAVMKNEFKEDNITYYLQMILAFAGQDEKVMYARFMETCEKRDAILQQIFQKEEAQQLTLNTQSGLTANVCLLSVAAKLEHRVRHMSVHTPSCTASCTKGSDDFSCNNDDLKNNGLKNNDSKNNGLKNNDLKNNDLKKNSFKNNCNDFRNDQSKSSEQDCKCCIHLKDPFTVLKIYSHQEINRLVNQVSPVC